MPLPVIKPKRDEILRCVAKFKELKGVSEGLPDMSLDECQRTFYSVLGFEQPTGKDENSPFGDAVRPKIGHLAPGFGMAYVEAAPGKGVLMHNHDTNETFLVVHGSWKMEWEGDQGNDEVVLGPLDVISFPVGVQRRFECVTPGEGRSQGLMLAVIEGEKPIAEFSPEARRRMAEGGVAAA